VTAAVLPRDLSVRPLRRTDIPHAERLRELAGFNQTGQDWERLLHFEPDGCFQATIAGTLVGTVTTTVYDRQLAWLGMVLVDPSVRGHGIGGRLVDHAVRYLETTRGVARTGLDATPAGEPLYRRRRFRTVYRLHRWQGTATRSGAATPGVRPMRPADLHAVVQLDRQALGTPRAAVLRALRDADGAICLVYHSGTRIAGFAMARPGTHRWHIGPLAAPGPDAANALLAALRTRLAGQPIEIDLPERLAGQLDDHQLEPVRPFTRMLRGNPALPDHHDHLYAPAGPELG
jgi:ribosomal protein S18 acetylase RimI-like enzyme